jgi:hypothetical protein
VRDACLPSISRPSLFFNFWRKIRENRRPIRCEGRGRDRIGGKKSVVMKMVNAKLPAVPIQNIFTPMLRNWQEMTTQTTIYRSIASDLLSRFLSDPR